MAPSDSRRRVRLFWLFVLLAFLAPFAIHAAERVVTELPVVEVTASRLPVSELPVSQSLIVIPSREITEVVPASLPEVLRRVAPVHVDQPGAPGGFSSLYLRGADPSHTVVLIDGVKVNDPTNPRGGGFDLSTLDVRTIDRIEILPGASSSVYGADAIAGVMNIITRAPQSTGAGFHAGVGGGSYRSASVIGSVRREELTFQAEGSGLNDGHASDDSFKRLRTGAIRVGWGPETSSHMRLSLRVMEHESGAFPEDSGGPRYAVLRGLEFRETTGTRAAIHGGTRVSWGLLWAYANVFDQAADTRSPGVAPGIRDPFGIPASITAADYRRYTAGATSSIELGTRASALVGTELQKETGDSASTLFFGPFAMPADFSLERDTYSLFTEGQYAVNRKISVQAGLRADDVERHGTHVSWRAGALYRLSDRDDQRFTFNLGTGFKPPSFFALAHPIVGNPMLVPEESRTAETAFAGGNLNTPYTYRVALFRSTYKNLVDFDAGPPPRLVNRTQVQMDGVDVALTANISRDVHGGAGLTWIDYDLPEGEGPLRNRPRLKAAVHAAYAITPHWSARLNGAWIGRTFDSSIPTGGMEVSPFFVADLAVSYANKRGVRLSFAVDNIFDRDYEQFIGFPSRGRRGRIEASIDL